ncbi:MAG: signal transduction [Geobacteraceae bacterium]|nr:MAG: signal transduction [Geobacteraceae bacterium]
MTDKRSAIKDITKDTRTLPTLPGIITKLNSMSVNRKVSVQEMARVVSSDQVLSARVLRLVNSPSYGFYRVSTISNAMILLGVDVVKSLTLSSSIFEIMEKTVVGLWEHSLGTGIAANIIARRLCLPDCEEISTAALLHDIGKVIIKIKCEDDYGQLMEVMEKKDISMLDAERELLDTDHTEVGAWLTKSWFLPDKLIEPIACHHDVERAVNHQIKTAVVHLADVLIKASGFGFSGDDSVPPINPIAWQKLGINDSLLTEIVAELEDKLIEAKNFSLEIQATDAPHS